MQITIESEQLLIVEKIVFLRNKNEDNGKVCQSYQCELRCFLADEVVTH